MSFRLVPKSVTLNDLERRNGRYFALFHRTRVRCGQRGLPARVTTHWIGLDLYADRAYSSRAVDLNFSEVDCRGLPAFVIAV